jgi:hypothetical protein
LFILKLSRQIYDSLLQANIGCWGKPFIEKYLASNKPTSHYDPQLGKALLSALTTNTGGLIIIQS